MMGPRDVKASRAEGHVQHAAGEHGEEIARLNRQWRERRDAYWKRSGTSRASTPATPALEEADGSDAGLTAAAAAGNVADCQRIISSSSARLHARGPDGVTPLSAAALRGHADVVRLLLEAAADPTQRNSSGPRATPLHAAAQHEHGKICMMLLAAHANPLFLDDNGVTPTDFASCSEPVWPHFAGAGCSRTAKEDLVAKGVIRRASAALEQELRGSGAEGKGGSGPSTQGLLSEFSRPGSAYVLSAKHPPRPGSAVLPSGATMKSCTVATPRPWATSQPGTACRTGSTPWPSGTPGLGSTPRPLSTPRSCSTPRPGSRSSGSSRSSASRPIDILAETDDVGMGACGTSFGAAGSNKVSCKAMDVVAPRAMGSIRGLSGVGNFQSLGL